MSCTAAEWKKWAAVFGITGGGGGGNKTSAISGVKAVYAINLAAVYDNGVAGVGATLTMSNPGAIPLANGGVELHTGERVAIIGQNSQLQNGIYTVTFEGDDDESGIYTRATDYDTAASIVLASYTAVALGDELYRATILIQTTENVVVGTSPIVFERYQPQPAASSNAVRGCISIYTTNLDATYDNGPNFDGVGATLTANSVGLLPDASGVTLTTGDRVVVNGQSAKLQNGIYDVQDIGGVSNLYILSRARDYDEYFNITVASYAPVAQGTHAGTLYVQKNKNITVGTSEIEFIDRADLGAFDSLNMIYVDPNGDNANTGRSEDSPMANPFDAIVKYVGTLANPQCVAVNTAVYAMPDTFIRPNCSVQCAAGTKLDVSFFIDLDVPIWSAAAAGSGSYFIGGTWEGTWTCDFGAAGAFKYLWFQDVEKVGTATFANGAIIFYRNVTVNGFTLNSATAYLRNSKFQGNVVVAPSLAGGESEIEIENCVQDVSFNVSLTGASGSVTTAKITGTPIQGTLTITGTFVNLKIDAVSIPAGGITYAGGATSAQVTIIGDAASATATTAALAGKQPLSSVLTAMTMNVGGIVFAGQNGSNSNSGTFNNMYLDPFFGSNSLTGTQTIPRLSFGMLSNFSTTSFAIKPNVFLAGQLNTRKNATAGGVWNVTNPITLDSSWNTAAANSAFYMRDIKWSATTVFSLNFSTATNGVFFVSENCTALSFQFTGAASHIPNILLSSTNDLGSGFGFSSVNSEMEFCVASSVSVVAAASVGATTHVIRNSRITSNASFSGNSSAAASVNISGTPIGGTLILTGTDVTLTIDQASYPAGGIILSGGALQSQVTVTGSTPVTLSSSAGVLTWDVGAAPNAQITLTENITSITVTNPIQGRVYELRIQQAAASSYTVAFPKPPFYWPGGSAFVKTAAFNSVDKVVFEYSNGRMEAGNPMMNIS